METEKTPKGLRLKFPVKTAGALQKYGAKTPPSTKVTQLRPQTYHNSIHITKNKVYT